MPQCLNASVEPLSMPHDTLGEWWFVIVSPESIGWAAKIFGFQKKTLEENKDWNCDIVSLYCLWTILSLENDWNCHWLLFFQTIATICIYIPVFSFFFVRFLGAESITVLAKIKKVVSTIKTEQLFGQCNYANIPVVGYLL